ncbi:PrsW family intramembrane metalloprotease [Mycobacterium sp. 155]|uniref:PrsW family intramembrane metalloprotease n=1 Tax=Mycobacterium sp. 155 TaxID=1157943 RepID=UPI000365E4C7|nr:PrsW family intramembrane metalloprotease [Mycobacterium sp. 155]
MTAPDRVQMDSLVAARVSAIDASGWGRRFVFIQPRNLAFWVYVLLVLVGLGQFVDSVGRFHSYSVLTAATVFAIYGAVIWWLAQRADRYTDLPVKLLITALVWGAFAATWAMAAVANTAIGDIYAKQFGQRWSLDWAAGLSAPITEELAKGAGLVLIIVLAPRIVRTAFDGFIIGLVIGLGFQLLEDMLYALRNEQGMALVMVLRMLTGVGGHFAYTAIFCAGLIYLLGRPAEPRRVGRGLLLMVTAPVLHGLWDSAGALVGGRGLLLVGLWAGILVVTLIIFFRVYVLTVPQERALLRGVLAPEVASGVLAEVELDAIAGNRKTRRRYRKSLRPRAARRKARQILQAGRDLAQELARSRGAETPAVQFARSEIGRIRSGEPSRW